MNKKIYVALMALMLALTASSRAWYDPSTRSFLSRDPQREGGGVNLYAYCLNQPLDYHDPLGGQPVPNGMGLSLGDIGRADMIGNMMGAGIPYEQAWQATTPRDPMMELHSRQALQVITTAGIVGMPLVAPVSVVGVPILDSALMGGGASSFLQLQANAFAQRPLMAGVPESAAAGFVLGGGAAAIVRGAGAVPSLVRPVTAPSVEFPMIPGMPLGYAGGPGAAWAGEMSPSLAHLTDEAGIVGIGQTGNIIGKNGIFAVPQSVTSESTIAKVFRTGLTPSKTAQFSPIPDSATNLFTRPVPIGPYSLWKYLGNVRYAPPGMINTATGGFTSLPSRIGPAALIYGPDIAIWGIGAGAGAVIYNTP